MIICQGISLIYLFIWFSSSDSEEIKIENSEESSASENKILFSLKTDLKNQNSSDNLNIKPIFKKSNRYRLN